MADEKIKLIGQKRKETNQAVVDVLSDVLEYANQGEAVALAVAFVKPDGNVMTSAIVNDYSYSLCGSLDWLKKRILDEIDDES